MPIARDLSGHKTTPTKILIKMGNKTKLNEADSS
jgi:hypothetical protein